MKNIILFSLVIYKRCKWLRVNFLYVFFNYLLFKRKSQNILIHPKAIIHGNKNIITKGLLLIGLNYNNLSNNKDITYLNVEGKLLIQGDFSIGRGCRIAIAENAIVEFGGNSDINCFSKITIRKGLKIGEDCTISWDCQFLDSDFHQIEYEGKKKYNIAEPIIIGDHVWIGASVSILKGVNIPKGCVVAANSVVTNSFEEENLLIAGNPAKVVKKNIQWKR